jgi:hypothetical protein
MPYALPDILAFALLLVVLWLALFRIVRWYQRRHEPPPDIIDGEIIYRSEEEKEK